MRTACFTLKQWCNRDREKLATSSAPGEGWGYHRGTELSQGRGANEGQRIRAGLAGEQLAVLSGTHTLRLLGSIHSLSL